MPALRAHQEPPAAAKPPHPRGLGDRMGRGGGIRTRVGEAARQPGEDDDQDKPLNRWSVDAWGKGKISSKDVLEIAAAAHAQGAVGALQLRSVKHARNAQRALVDALGLPSGAPDFTWLEIPTKRGPNTAHPFLLPHLWLEALHKVDELWSARVAGKPGAAKQFWSSMSHSPAVRDHPAMKRQDWGTSIPLGFHGDGGAFSHQDSLYVFAFNSLLGGGETKVQRFLMTTIRKTDLVPGSIEAIMKIFAWSFNCCVAGKSPSVDHTGRRISTMGKPRELAGGWKGILMSVRGDWDFYVSVFRFPHWQCAINMCWLCAASGLHDSELLYSDCSQSAQWRDTRRTHATWLAALRADGAPTPPLFDVVGLRLDAMMIDILHCVDLGVAAHIAANILLELVQKRAWGGSTQDVAIAALMVALKAWYSKQKSTRKVQGSLTLERLRTNGGWPKLKAKAAQVRHIARFVLEMALTHDAGILHDRRRLAIAQLLVRFYDLIEQGGMFLDASAIAEIQQIGKDLPMLYSNFAKEAFAAGVRMWKVQPKLNLFQHLCEWQVPLGLNPRMYWTYADEDLVGQLIEVASSCHPFTVHAISLFKWLHVSFKQ